MCNVCHSRTVRGLGKSHLVGVVQNEHQVRAVSSHDDTGMFYMSSICFICFCIWFYALWYVFICLSYGFIMRFICFLCLFTCFYMLFISVAYFFMCFGIAFTGFSLMCFVCASYEAESKTRASGSPSRGVRPRCVPIFVGNKDIQIWRRPLPIQWFLVTRLCLSCQKCTNVLANSIIFWLPGDVYDGIYDNM